MVNRSRLIILCGLPGAGKTTLAAQLEQVHSAVRLTPDDWLEALSIDLYDADRRAAIESLQWRLAERLLVRNVPVILDWGSWSRSERDQLRLGARALGATVELHYLAASPDLLFERVTRRGLERPPISRAMLAAWHVHFEPPGAEEMALFDAPWPTPAATGPGGRLAR